MRRFLPKKVLAVVLLGLLLAALLVLRGGGASGEKVVPDVAAVRHSEAPEAVEEAAAEVRTMVASYYAGVLEGEPTASGEPYEPERYTAAHKRLPLGTKLRVGYGGESVKVVVNDRGPFVEGRDIDLSLAAAQEIGLVEPGIATVRVTTL